jgi:hypothetical protein
MSDPLLPANIQRLNGSWTGNGFPLTEHVLETPRHTTFYLACGASEAPLVIFVHGWPELSHSWRHQLPVFAALGFPTCAATAARPSILSRAITRWSKSRPT